MSKDKRKKGCPNVECQMYIKKVKQLADNDFCPKCGTKLIFVCSKCFDEIEDIDRKHRICKKCEIENEEKTARIKDKAKKGITVVGKSIVVPVVINGVSAFSNEAGKEVRKHAANVGKKAIQAAFKGKV